MKLLSVLAALADAFKIVLGLWRDHRLRQSVRAEIERDQLRKQAAARVIAEEIEREVARTDLGALDERMRRYQRP